jgi:hypothetical protein
LLRLNSRKGHGGIDDGLYLGQGSSVFAAADELAEAIEDVACALCLLHDFRHAVVQQCRLGRRPGQQPQTAPCIGGDRGQRLAQLVRQSRGHFTSQRNPRDMGQFFLMLAGSSLYLPARGDVPDDDCVVFRIQQVEAADAELDRERVSIRPPRIELPTSCLGGR